MTHKFNGSTWCVCVCVHLSYLCSVRTGCSETRTNAPHEEWYVLILPPFNQIHIHDSLTHTLAACSVLLNYYNLHVSALSAWVAGCPVIPLVRVCLFSVRTW